MFENTIDLSKIFNLQNAIIYLILINIITFVVMGIDKKKATFGKWRIKETSTGAFFYMLRQKKYFPW